MRILFVTMVLLLFGMNFTSNEKELHKTLNKLRNDWITKFNYCKPTIASLYCDKGTIFTNLDVKIVDAGISTYLLRLKEQFGDITGSRSLGIIKNDDSHYLETGYYTVISTETPKLFFITSWRKENDKWLKELDILIPGKDCTSSINEIKQIQSNFSSALNNNKPAEVFDKYYTIDAVFFTHSTLLNGQDQVINKLKTFSEQKIVIDYKIKKLIPIDPNIIFDIGINNSTKTLYSVIWEKQIDSSWKVIMHFTY